MIKDVHDLSEVGWELYSRGWRHECFYSYYRKNISWRTFSGQTRVLGGVGGGLLYCSRQAGWSPISVGGEPQKVAGGNVHWGRQTCVWLGTLKDTPSVLECPWVSRVEVFWFSSVLECPQVSLSQSFWKILLFKDIIIIYSFSKKFEKSSWDLLFRWYVHLGFLCFDDMLIRISFIKSKFHTER